MEYPKEIDNFILCGVSNSTISISKMIWPEKFNIALFDFEICCNIQGTKYYGRGTDKNEETALLKALSESIERYSFRQTDLKTTNGCAVHFNENIAKQNAKNELIERDTILLYFLCNLKFEKLKTKKEENPIYQIIHSHNFRVVQIYLPNEISHVVLTVIYNNVCFFTGSANSETLHESKEKSLIEGFRHFWHNINYPTYPSDYLAQFMKKSTHNFNDHALLAFDAKYQSFLKKDLRNKVKTNVKCLKQPYTFEKYNNEILNTCKMYFYKCSNIEALELDTGYFKTNDMQNNRILNLGIDLNKIVQYPHFLK